MKWLLFVTMLSTSYGAFSQPIYKSIDKDGNVSYSSEPNSNAVKVETVAPPPEPTPEEVERAQLRYQELEARDREREKIWREQEREALQRQQIQADAELRRQLSNQKPNNIIVINQNPYYWGRGWGYWNRWGKVIKPGPNPVPVKPVRPKLYSPSKQPGSMGGLLKR